MELWIPITIAAAFAQNLRSALQKQLSGRLSTSAATLARFLYAAPLSWLLIALLTGPGGYALPGITSGFVGFMLLGGLTQILATGLLVSLFALRNFAVGTTFSKTETVQTALVGIVVLGESLTPGATVGILVSLVGVLMISTQRGKIGLAALFSQVLDRPALVGIASGAMFGISAVSYRAASLALDGGDFVIRASLLLACATVYQSVVMTVYMALREPEQLRATIVGWRASAAVSVAGMLGSLCWMLAMTLQNAAMVRALGQVELLFTFAAYYLFFGERSTSRELAGMALVTAGILVLLLWR